MIVLTVENEGNIFTAAVDVISLPLLEISSGPFSHNHRVLECTLEKLPSYRAQEIYKLSALLCGHQHEIAFFLPAHTHLRLRFRAVGVNLGSAIQLLPVCRAGRSRIRRLILFGDPSTGPPVEFDHLSLALSIPVCLIWICSLRCPFLVRSRQCTVNISVSCRLARIRRGINNRQQKVIIVTNLLPATVSVPCIVYNQCIALRRTQRNPVVSHRLKT